MKIKQVKQFWTLIATLALVLAVLPAFAGESQPSGDKVAVVNGAVITRADFDRELSIVQEQFLSMGKQPNDSQLAEIKKDLLESLIDREVLYQESQKNGIKIGDEAINKKLNELKKQFSSEAEFKNALDKTGLSETAIIAQLNRAMGIQQFIDKQQFDKKVTISEKETRDYYDSQPDLFKKPEELRASHILIKVDPKADKAQKAEARKKLETIQQRLKKGEDFAALAKEFSQCPSNTKGGDLGYFRRGQMVKSFDEAAFALKTAEVSDIVDTEYGYHLIKVTDKKPASTIAYQDIKGKIGDHLKKTKVQQEINQYVEQLKAKAKVERYLSEGT